MNKVFAAAAVSLLIAAPALAQTEAPQPPAAPTQEMHRGGEHHGPMGQMHRDGQGREQMGQMHRGGERHEHAKRSALHRGRAERQGLRTRNCPADATDEAGNFAHPGGYCLPGGRS